MSSYSKGSRGLSVLPRVHCIFTASSISLSLGWRQPGHHYAIRAGRNLPDKEFRYLRTVIVTAAVYRGFDQELRVTANPINYPSGTGQASHRIRPLSCLHSAVFLINSCSQLVSSTDFSSTSKSLHLHISVPSPEVTAPFCLVPSPEFSQAPWYSLPDHLCRFGVRFDVT